MRIATLVIAIQLFCIGSLSAKPNVLIFLVDDLGWTDLGYTGSKYYESPNIDALSRESIVFTNAYSNGPNCAPTRACLMSGQYSPRHGIYTVGDPVRGNHKFRRWTPVENATVLDDKVVTLAETFSNAGYSTVHLGKWHLGKDPTTQGFDLNYAGFTGGSPSKGGYHSPYAYPNVVEEKEGRYLTDHLTDLAVKYIQKQSAEEPFFMYMSHYAVHTPIQAKASVQRRFDSKKPSGSHKSPKYAAMIASMDESLGRIMSALEDVGKLEETIIVFASDNGGYGGITGQEPLRGSKGMLYEGGIRVPMLVRLPNGQNKGIENTPVMSMDLYPTLTSYCDIATEELTLDGIDLSPRFAKGGSLSTERAVYWHFPCYLQRYPGLKIDSPFRCVPSSAIRKGDWKLIHSYETDAIELYNLAADIGETNDLSTQKQEIAKSLYGELEAWRKRVNAGVPTVKNPRYDPNAKFIK